MDPTALSSDDATAKENVTTDSTAVGSSENSPEPMEVEEATNRPTSTESRDNDRPGAVRQRGTTSTDSLVDDYTDNLTLHDQQMDYDGENEQEDEDEEEEEEGDDDDEEDVGDSDDAVQEAANESIGANASFSNPLSTKDNLIHVGNEYQAIIDQSAVITTPATSSSVAVEAMEEEIEREYRVWDCNVDLDEQKLSEYVTEAHGRFELGIDRCLYILLKSEYDFDKAINACASRRDIKDEWTKEESSLFAMCFFHFGKNFKKIHAAMPERSLSSIIQHYYNTKKQTNYKTMINVHLNEKDTYDEMFEDFNEFERVAAGMCENCSRQSDFLILNRVMKRHECKPCMIYFRLMRAPRPATLMAMKGRRHRVLCPLFMKPYIKHYYELSAPANGKSSERLNIGKTPVPEEDDDDDCKIIDECPLRRPSKPYIPSRVYSDDPVDSNTCRMTRCFETTQAKRLLANVRKVQHPCVPLVWRAKQTQCMEDIQLINDEARQLMLSAMNCYNSISKDEARHWVDEMHDLRVRCRAKHWEPELDAGSSRSGKVRADPHWTKDEKNDVVKCFHWYHTDFEATAEVMGGTKTVEQIKAFYLKHQDIIDKSVEEYRKEMRQNLRFDTPPNENHRPSPMFEEDYDDDEIQFL